LLLPLTASGAEPYCWATEPALVETSEHVPGRVAGPASDPLEDPDEDPPEEPESDAELSAPEELAPLALPPLLLPLLPLELPLDADPPPEVDGDPESVPVPSPCSPGTVVQATPANQKTNGTPPRTDLLKRFATPGLVGARRPAGSTIRPGPGVGKPIREPSETAAATTIPW
jgi:hypothetical protein